MKKVLMIAYPFPPMGGSGVQRTVKFAKYLPSFGWHPIVLTVSNPPLNESDYSYLKELPEEVKVYRAPDFGSYYFNSPRKEPIIEAVSYLTLKNKNKGNKLVNYMKSVMDSLVFIPDRSVGWMPLALNKGARIIRKLKINLIYSTSDPFTDHLIGFILKCLSGKPWIADFRDPWTINDSYKQPFSWRNRINKELEFLFLRKADKVIVTCGSLIDEFQLMYPSIGLDKFVEITNGYDSTDFEGLITEEISNSKLVIAVSGRFYSRKNFPLGVLCALKELSKKSLFRENIILRIIGKAGTEAKELVQKLDLNDIVEFVGYIPHKQCLKHISHSDVLLLNINNERGFKFVYPGKVFEYLATGKPILSTVIEGATAKLIRELDAGVVVPPNDVLKIKEAIEKMYFDKMCGCLSSLSSKVVVKMFERKNLTSELADCFNQVI